MDNMKLNKQRHILREAIAISAVFPNSLMAFNGATS
jgi:hypothetical protein